MVNCCVSQRRFEDYRKCFCEVAEGNPEARSSFTVCKIAAPSSMARNDIKVRRMIARVAKRQRNDTLCHLSIFESNHRDSNYLNNPAAGTFSVRQGEKSFAITGLPAGIAVKIPAKQNDSKVTDYRKCLCEERSDEAISRSGIAALLSVVRNDTLCRLAILESN